MHDNTITATGTGLDITRTAGTVTITAFDDNVVSGASGGTGIVVTGPAVTFDATPGGAYNQVGGRHDRGRLAGRQRWAVRASS